MDEESLGIGAGAGREEPIMAWSMHAGHRYEEAQSRWHHPPPVEEGQVARVHAPTATSLLVEHTDDDNRR